MFVQDSALLAVFREALPPEGVLSDATAIDQQYRRNVTALERRVPLVLRPSSEDEVRRIVGLANEHRIALYPFSTGKNWGLGSKLPVIDGCVLVDLSRMNRIVTVNDVFGYTIIEPGVTQTQLAAYLQDHHPGLTMNFTGSFGHTSIVGNVLERGDGAYARVHDLLGVRGLLGNGKPFQVGGWWNAVGSSQPSHYAKYTAGPDLSGLFTHSNVGIVTQMAFRLLHKPECRYIFWGVAADLNLECVVDTCAYLDHQGVINRESVNMGYANRFVQAASSLHTEGEQRPDDSEVWNFYVLVTGTRRVTGAVIEELQAAFKPLCLSLGAFCINEGHDPYAELPTFLHPLVQPLMGVPDTESIKAIYHLTSTPLPTNPLELDADQTSFGMKCSIPVIPPRGEYVRRAARIVAAVRIHYALQVKLSVFGDGRALITIHFRSDDAEQVQRAQQCEAALWQAMAEAGFPPYRVSIDQMQRLFTLQPEFFELVAQVKAVFDPNGILAPGRYSPLSTGHPGLRPD